MKNQTKALEGEETKQKTEVSKFEGIYTFRLLQRRVAFFAAPSLLANFVETHLYTSSGLLIICAAVHKSPSSDVYNSEEENGRNKNR